MTSSVKGACTDNNIENFLLITLYYKLEVTNCKYNKLLRADAEQIKQHLKNDKLEYIFC